MTECSSLCELWICLKKWVFIPLNHWCLWERQEWQFVVSCSYHLTPDGMQLTCLTTLDFWAAHEFKYSWTSWRNRQSHLLHLSFSLLSGVSITTKHFSPHLHLIDLSLRPLLCLTSSPLTLLENRHLCC